MVFPGCTAITLPRAFTLKNELFRAVGCFCHPPVTQAHVLTELSRQTAACDIRQDSRGIA